MEMRKLRNSEKEVVVELIRKDILANGRSILNTGVVILGITILMIRGVGSEKKIIDLMFLANINLFAAMYWAHCLVSLEMTQGTLRWLRVLPVSDRAIIISKWLLMAGLVTVFFALSYSTTVGEWVLQNPLMTLLLWSGSILVGSAFLCGMWIFGARLGQTIPILLAALIVFSIWKSEEWGLAILTKIIQALSTDLGIVSVSLLALVLSGGLAWLTYLWLHRREGFELVE